MRVANAQKLLPFSVVSLTKTAAPQLNDLLMHLLARACKSGTIQHNSVDILCLYLNLISNSILKLVLPMAGPLSLVRNI